MKMHVTETMTRIYHKVLKIGLENHTEKYTSRFPWKSIEKLVLRKRVIREVREIIDRRRGVRLCMKTTIIRPTDGDSREELRSNLTENCEAKLYQYGTRWQAYINEFPTPLTYRSSITVETILVQLYRRGHSPVEL